MQISWQAIRPLLLAGLAGATGCGQSSGAAPDAGSVSDARTTLGPLPSLDGATAGYALSFDGVKDYATAGNGGFAPVDSPMTLEMWIRYPSGMPDQDFIVLRAGVSSGVRLGTHAGTITVRRVYVDRVLAQTPSLPPVKVWHHVAYTFDLTNDVLYVDGAALDTEAQPTDTHTPNSVWLGTFDGSTNLFKGEMDEVRVWTVSRTAAQIQADMHHRPAGSEPGLAAYWTFDDTQPGGRSADDSGNGNDVTLGNGVAERMPARVPSDAPVGH